MPASVVIHPDEVTPVPTPKGVTTFLVDPEVSGGASVMIRQWAPGTLIERHAHPASEMFYVLTGRLLVEGRGVGPGTVLFIPAGESYGPIEVIEGPARLLRYYEAPETRTASTARLEEDVR